MEPSGSVGYVQTEPFAGAAAVTVNSFGGDGCENVAEDEDGGR